MVILNEVGVTSTTELSMALKAGAVLLRNAMIEEESWCAAT